MAKENSNSIGSKNTLAEAQRLSNAITKLFVAEKAAPEAGVIALSISIGYAAKQFSNPEDLEDNLARITETVKRVANDQPLTNVNIATSQDNN